MKRGYIITSICSALAGAAIMLLALGGSRASGIEGWTPVNREVAMTLEESMSGANRATSQSAVDAAETSRQAVGISSGEQVAPSTETSTGEGTGAAVNDKGQNDRLDVKAATSSDGAKQGNESVAETQGKSGLININTAGLAELQEIPGIGEKKAQAIIHYRNEHGSFQSVNDLTQVKGIGTKMLEKMKPYIGLN
ncbi:ComEA family DNA-binding protein [Paenibacillus aceti]|uniref:ComE operon protein 1 n=1 Tax=Paenibacillus aceti TaxID=1820010 RepID=A0ABQ1VN95_9BACL|nr:ComEA family DNA-binding protein [Paenibacillus aceti]GGF83569.1 ComE operon protein 1 [Paenibacillus aceti]